CFIAGVNLLVRLQISWPSPKSPGCRENLLARVKMSRLKSEISWLHFHQDISSSSSIFGVRPADFRAPMTFSAAPPENFGPQPRDLKCGQPISDVNRRILGSARRF